MKKNRDAWSYSISNDRLTKTMAAMLSFYEKQRKAFSEIAGAEPLGKRVEMAGEFIDRDKAKIQWSEGLIGALAKNQKRVFDSDAIRTAHYRPFCKHAAYFHPELNDRVYRLPLLFPKKE